LSGTDFAWIAQWRGITDRDEAFKKAADVIASITWTVKQATVGVRSFSYANL
jgi:hypothetical protein